MESLASDGSYERGNRSTVNRGQNQTRQRRKYVARKFWTAELREPEVIRFCHPRRPARRACKYFIPSGWVQGSFPLTVLQKLLFLRRVFAARWCWRSLSFQLEVFLRRPGALPKDWQPWSVFFGRATI